MRGSGEVQDDRPFNYGQARAVSRSRPSPSDRECRRHLRQALDRVDELEALAARDEATCVALRQLLTRLSAFLGEEDGSDPFATELREYAEKARATLPENLETEENG